MRKFKGVKSKKIKKQKEQISRMEYDKIIDGIKTKRYVPVWLDTVITLAVLGALTYTSILSVYDFAVDMTVLLFFRAVALSAMFIVWTLVTLKFMVKLARGEYKK